MRDNPAVLSNHLDPIFESAEIVVRQDAEWSVPAFYVISTIDHYDTWEMVPSAVRRELVEVCDEVRAMMKDYLKVPKIHQYLEESYLRSHVHVWLLPVWDIAFSTKGLGPRIYEGNVHEYLAAFSFIDRSQEILKMNDLARTILRRQK